MVEEQEARDNAEAGPSCEQPDDPLLYVMDGTSLKEKLLETINELETGIKKCLKSIFHPDVSQDDRAKLFKDGHETYICSKIRLDRQLEFVAPHQEREADKRLLKAHIEDRDETISIFARKLERIESVLLEAGLQANRRLSIAETARANPVDINSVIRASFFMSRGYSVSAPFNWNQGDPSRPFPTEADFATSQLMQMQQQRQRAAPSVLNLIRGADSNQSTPRANSAASTPTFPQPPSVGSSGSSLGGNRISMPSTSGINTPPLGHRYDSNM
ncbi:unnamed protein product [Bursaphelenchus xylophilus]|uniref:Mediator of RNA polymerase II transcription subunit 4 n=1 Tax=Bursaphelenchus xylophilus TaxID=6326 RepID=A0A1I7RW33_BURXY|nr:unnamed protein product [Bursaphelenchus xylophilus]CAG9095069.1 unnamed protein product [Bursaphelenchus xylophilus]